MIWEVLRDHSDQIFEKTEDLKSENLEGLSILNASISFESGTRRSKLVNSIVSYLENQDTSEYIPPQNFENSKKQSQKIDLKIG